MSTQTEKKMKYNFTSNKVQAIKCQYSSDLLIYSVFTRLIQLYKVVSPLNIVGLNTRGLSQIHVDKSKV